STPAQKKPSTKPDRLQAPGSLRFSTCGSARPVSSNYDMSRKTKLICTLGPATESEEVIGRLIDAGTNMFRLNMSHAKHEWAAEMTRRVRHQAEQRGEHIPVLFDLTGPSIRTGDLETPY